MRADLITTLFNYLWYHKIFTLVVLYTLGGILINLFFRIDICIPCLWKTLFGFECPGCGLTTAFIHFIQLDMAGAWEANPLLFLVMPLGLWFVRADYLQFRTTQQKVKFVPGIDSGN